MLELNSSRLNVLSQIHVLLLYMFHSNMFKLLLRVLAKHVQSKNMF